MHIFIGAPAYIKVVAHPRLSEFNNRYEDSIQRTSRVISYDKVTGRLETENTIYQKVNDEQTLRNY